MIDLKRGVSHILISLSLILVAFETHADPRQGQRLPKTSSQPPAQRQISNISSPPVQTPITPERGKSINFEDEIIEGMNKNPFDSLTQIGRKDNSGQTRLYKRKSNFRHEIKHTVREMGLLQ